MPERGRDEVRRPEVLRLERVVLVEVDDRAAEPVLDRRRRLADDRAHDAGSRGHLERGEEIRERGRHAQLPEDLPVAGRVRVHELDRARIRGVEPAQRVDGHGEKREIRGDDRHAHPVVGRPARDFEAPEADDDHGRDGEQGNRLRGDDVRHEATAEHAELREQDAEAEPEVAPIANPTAASFAVKSAASPEHVDQPRPLRRRGLQELADDRVQVGDRRVVDDERPRPAGGHPEPAIALPQPPRHTRTTGSMTMRKTVRRDMAHCSTTFTIAPCR